MFSLLLAAAPKIELDGISIRPAPARALLVMKSRRVATGMGDLVFILRFNGLVLIQNANDLCIIIDHEI